MIELAKKIPHEISYKKNVSKYILKKILSKYLPKELWDRPKKGFSSPNKEWLSGNFNKDDVFETFSRFDFINRDILYKILNDYSCTCYKYKNIVWRMYYFDKWIRAVEKYHYQGSIK